MQASKVILVGETKEALKFRPLTQKQKRTLREQRIKDLIASKPAFTRIKTKEFGRVTELPDNGVWPVVKSMARQGKIQMVNLSKRTYGFALPGEIHVSKLPGEQQIPDVEAVIEELPAAPGGGTTTLGAYAKDFAWAANSDSLREFVAWMDGKELDLRRLGEK